MKLWIKVVYQDCDVFLFFFGRTPYAQEQVNIGSGPPDSKVRWFRSSSNEPRFINTVTFDSKDDSPTLVMVHGYAASQGFFFRNFDALASRFRVIAIDQLGWALLLFIHNSKLVFCANWIIQLDTFLQLGWI